MGIQREEVRHMYPLSARFHTIYAMFDFNRKFLCLSANQLNYRYEATFKG